MLSLTISQRGNTDNYHRCQIGTISWTLQFNKVFFQTGLVIGGVAPTSCSLNCFGKKKATMDRLYIYGLSMSRLSLLDFERAISDQKFCINSRTEDITTQRIQCRSGSTRTRWFKAMSTKAIQSRRFTKKYVGTPRDLDILWPLGIQEYAISAATRNSASIRERRL